MARSLPSPLSLLGRGAGGEGRRPEACVCVRARRNAIHFSGRAKGTAPRERPPHPRPLSPEAGERGGRPGPAEYRPVSTSYLLAIDQGTTGTRAIVYDGRGRAAGSAGQELPQHYPRPGWV